MTNRTNILNREPNILNQEAPEATPAMRAAAREAGATVTAWSPEQTKRFLTGDLTLGDLEGISKEEQYEMAQRGFALFEEGRLDRARNVFEGLHALDPFDAYFLTALGCIAQREDDLEAADAYFSRALDVNPFAIAARSNRGEVRVLLGRLGEAADDFAKVAELDPDGGHTSARRARAIATVVLSEMEAVRSARTNER